MPEATTSAVEMTCLQGMADLERMEGPWLESIADGEPEVSAITLRLLLAHMTTTSHRLMSAMVLDRMDSERATASKAVDRLQSGPTL
ncbi:hypothetical protein [Synechococcus sp. CC9616]|uniref:hypothetical protein n=1 Tax=Synechococcus sp. CC9616 TaxID=110663 RepID=UPI0004B1DE1F|nr:hypothetical protein [Synechococcus sp. CC9616]